MYRTLETTLEQGDCVLYQDYRSGALVDRSGYSNHGNAVFSTAPIWTGRGASFIDSTRLIVVPDQDDLRLTQGALIVLGDFTSQMTYENIINKRDSGGINYQLYLDSTQVNLYDGVTIRTLTADVRGKEFLGVNFKSGELGEGFVNGVYVGDFSGISTFTTDDAPVYIGNVESGGSVFKSLLKAVLIFNRTLTETEFSRLYAELSTLQWSKKVFSISHADMSVDPVDGAVASWNLFPVEDQVIDQSGNGYDGDVQKGTIQEWTSLGSALKFNGANGFVDVSALDSYPNGKGYLTLSCWVNFTAAQSGKEIMGWWYAEDNDLRIQTNKVVYSADGTGLEEYAASNQVLNDGLWHHIVGTYDKDLGSDNVKLYVDGVLQTKTGASVGDMLSTSRFNIASINDSVAGTWNFDGRIIAPKIYDFAQDQVWVTEEYLKGRSSIFQTTYGAHESFTPITGGRIENTPLQVESGSFEVSTESILGYSPVNFISRDSDVKAISCVSPGVAGIPSSYMQQTDVEAAYGEWEFWVYHPSSGDDRVLFISSVLDSYDSNQDGYSIDIDSSERVQLSRLDAGTVTSLFTSPISEAIEGWNGFKVVRTPGNEFSVYRRTALISYVPVSVSSGTNPIVDSTYTISKFFTYNPLVAGGKIVYATETGDLAIKKWLLSW